MLKITHKRTYFAFQESQISIYILFDFCLSKYLIFQTTCSDWLLDIFCANYTIYFYAFQDGKILNSGSIRVKSSFPPTIKLFPRSKLLWSIEENIIWDIDEFKKTETNQNHAHKKHLWGEYIFCRPQVNSFPPRLYFNFRSWLRREIKDQ